MQDAETLHIVADAGRLMQETQSDRSQVRPRFPCEVSTRHLTLMSWMLNKSMFEDVISVFAVNTVLSYSSLLVAGAVAARPTLWKYTTSRATAGLKSLVMMEVGLVIRTINWNQSVQYVVICLQSTLCCMKCVCVCTQHPELIMAACVWTDYSTSLVASMVWNISTVFVASTLKPRRGQKSRPCTTEGRLTIIHFRL